MIQKIYEIGCDWCGNAWHGYRSLKYAEDCYRDLGGVVTGGKHFCNENCREQYYDQKGKK